MERPERPRRHKFISQRQTPRSIICPRPTRLSHTVEFDVNFVSESDSDTDSQAVNLGYGNYWPERALPSGMPSSYGRQIAEQMNLAYDQHQSQAVRPNNSEEYDPQAPSFHRHPLQDPGPSTSSTGSRILDQIEHQFMAQAPRPYLTARRRVTKRNASPLRMEQMERDLITQQRGFFPSSITSNEAIPFLNASDSVMSVCGPYNVFRQINTAASQRFSENNQEDQYSLSNRIYINPNFPRPPVRSNHVSSPVTYNDTNLNRSGFEPRSPVLEPRSPDYPPQTPPPSSPQSSNGRSHTSEVMQHSPNLSPRSPEGEPPTSPSVQYQPRSPERSPALNNFLPTLAETVIRDLEYELTRGESPTIIPLSPETEHSVSDDDSNLHSRNTLSPASPVNMDVTTDYGSSPLRASTPQPAEERSNNRDVSCNRESNSDVVVIDRRTRCGIEDIHSVEELITEALNLVKQDPGMSEPVEASSEPSETDKSDPKNSSKLLQLNQGLVSLLECPVCMDLIEPPIMQCNKGHLVCSECRPKLSACPTCRCRMADRNMAMEKVAEKLLYPCRYSTVGCKEMVKLKDKPQHESCCGFKQFDCLVSNCQWKGYRPEMLVHLTNSHNDKLVIGNSQVVSASLDTLHRYLIFHTYEELFLVSFTTYMVNKKFFCCAQIIGAPGKASNFVVNLKLKRDRYDSVFKVEQHLVEVVEDNYKISDLYSSDSGIILDMDVIKNYIMPNHRVNLFISILKRDSCSD